MLISQLKNSVLPVIPLAPIQGQGPGRQQRGGRQLGQDELRHCQRQQA